MTRPWRMVLAALCVGLLALSPLEAQQDPADPQPPSGSPEETVEDECAGKVVPRTGNWTMEASQMVDMTKFHGGGGVAKVEVSAWDCGEVIGIWMKGVESVFFQRLDRPTSTEIPTITIENYLDVMTHKAEELPAAFSPNVQWYVWVVSETDIRSFVRGGSFLQAQQWDYSGDELVHERELTIGWQNYVLQEMGVGH